MTDQQYQDFVLSERKLLKLSLACAISWILVYWGHRWWGLRELADGLTWLQVQTLPWAGPRWFAQAFFLLPCVLCAILLLRQLWFFRYVQKTNVLLLLFNVIFALHSWSCVEILSR